MDQSSKLSNIKYLQCQKKGTHEGETLNIVCLNANCIKLNTFICCCSCIDQSHEGHKVKSMKKLLIEAETLANQIKGNSKTANDVTSSIYSSLFDKSQEDSLKTFKRFKEKIIQSLDQMEAEIVKYHETFKEELIKSSPKAETKSQFEKIQEQIDKIANSKNYQLVSKNLMQIISLLRNSQQNNLKKDVKKQKKNQNTNQNVLQFIKLSKEEIIDNNIYSLRNIMEKLNENSQILSKNNAKLKNLKQRQEFVFSSKYKHKDIILLSNKQIIFKPEEDSEEEFSDNKYISGNNMPNLLKNLVHLEKQINRGKSAKKESQFSAMALMEPAIKLTNSCQTVSFRFHIKKLSNDQIAIGICDRNRWKELEYEFDETVGRSYQIISKGKRKVKASDQSYEVSSTFQIHEGDTITCIITKSKLYFLKNAASNNMYNFASEKTQSVQFQIREGEDLSQFYPFVTCFDEDTEIEYICSVLDLYSQKDIPQPPLLFSKNLRNKGISLSNNLMIASCKLNEYMYCFLDKDIEELMKNIPAKRQTKEIRFNFKILACTGLIAFGISYLSKIEKLHYNLEVDTEANGEDFFKISHSYAMDNSGVTYHESDQPEQTINGFKFKTGDIVECIVRYEPLRNVIIFAKGQDRCQLLFELRPNDYLFPCVVFQKMKNQVSVLPVCP